MQHSKTIFLLGDQSLLPALDRFKMVKTIVSMPKIPCIEEAQRTYILSMMKIAISLLIRGCHISFKNCLENLIDFFICEKIIFLLKIRFSEFSEYSYLMIKTFCLRLFILLLIR